MLPKFSKITLENGLEVYHIPVNRTSGVISVDVFYKVGSRNETMGKSGIAHMLEHMNFKSTSTRKAGEFDSIVKSFGGVSNASTGFDYTHYFIKCARSNLGVSLELFADIMQNLNLKEEEFLPERDVVLEERRWRTDNSPFGYLFFRLFNNAFLYHPYHWTPIGFIDDIKNWTIEDIRNFHAKYYQPKNAFIIIAGDIDEDEAFNAAKANFETIKNRCDIPEFYTFEPKLDGEKRIYLKKQSEVDLLAVAFRVPKFNHQDQVCLSALADYFALGQSSLFESILIDKKRLINQVEVFNMSLIDESLFVAMAVCNENIKADMLAKEIKKLCDKTKTASISKSQLEKIKNGVKSKFIYSMQSAGSVASVFGSYIARGDLDFLLRYEDSMSKIDSNSLNLVAKKYFNNPITVILRKD